MRERGHSEPRPPSLDSRAIYPQCETLAQHHVAIFLPQPPHYLALCTAHRPASVHGMPMEGCRRATLRNPAPKGAQEKTR